MLGLEHVLGESYDICIFLRQVMTCLGQLTCFGDRYGLSAVILEVK